MSALACVDRDTEQCGLTIICTDCDAVTCVEHGHKCFQCYTGACRECFKRNNARGTNLQCCDGIHSATAFACSNCHFNCIECKKLMCRTNRSVADHTKGEAEYCTGCMHRLTHDGISLDSESSEESAETDDRMRCSICDQLQRHPDQEYCNATSFAHECCGGRHIDTVVCLDCGFRCLECDQWWCNENDSANSRTLCVMCYDRLSEQSNKKKRKATETITDSSGDADGSDDLVYEMWKEKHSALRQKIVDELSGDEARRRLKLCLDVLVDTGVLATPTQFRKGIIDSLHHIAGKDFDQLISTRIGMGHSFPRIPW